MNSTDTIHKLSSADMAWSIMWFSFKQVIGFDSHNQHGYSL
jgi:hypothetical protein